jgi:ariadne-1
VCFLVKKWLKKCQDDSETANWISANTKECTKCNTTIEKVCILTGSFFADF